MGVPGTEMERKETQGKSSSWKPGSRKNQQSLSSSLLAPGNRLKGMAGEGQALLAGDGKN